VVACGGGVVETPDACDILIEYYISGEIVLNVYRDATRVLKYLQIDKTRPTYEEDMMGSICGVRDGIKNAATIYVC
jgi:pentafunctional AROM polypeptide